MEPQKEPTTINRSETMVSVTKTENKTWRGKPFLEMVEFKDITGANYPNRCGDDAWGSVTVMAAQGGINLQLRAHQVVKTPTESKAAPKHMIATTFLSRAVLEALIPHLKELSEIYK